MRKKENQRSSRLWTYRGSFSDIKKFEEAIFSEKTWRRRRFSDLKKAAASVFTESEDKEACFQNHGDVLVWAVAVLFDSPVAAAFLEEAIAENWSVTLDDLELHDFHINVPEKLIILGCNGLHPPALGQSKYFRNMVLVSLVRALRDVWQEKRHGGFDVKYDPEAVLMLERTRAADLDVMAILIGWELRSAGYGDLWRHLIGSEKGDVAMCFSSYLERNALGDLDRAALAAAFRQWFSDTQRVSICDHETLEYMDGLVKGNAGKNPFGGKKLTVTDIEVLSCLPDKTAYLRRHGKSIMSDPLYAGLGDPINQSHFMHILYDLKVVFAGNVPFRDVHLARKIFPGVEMCGGEEAFLETE